LSRATSKRSVRGALLLGCALTIVLVGHLHFANITLDDAFISFRYGENLANGHGLVFNLGERVEGSGLPSCTRRKRIENAVTPAEQTPSHAQLARGQPLLAARRPPQEPPLDGITRKQDREQQHVR
jgi:hypothetical protein